MLFSALINAAIVGTVATAVFWTFLRIVSRGALNAATRYALWWIALLLLVILPVAFVPSLNLRNPQPPALGSLPLRELALLPAPVTKHVPVAADNLGAPPNSGAIRPKVETEGFPVQRPGLMSRLYSQMPLLPLRVKAGLWLQLALSLWLLATLILLSRLVLSYRALSLRCARAADAPEQLRRHAEGWIELSKTRSRPVRFAVSEEIDTPLAIGLRRSAILIPAAYVNDFTEADLEQICVHEAAHLARSDDIALLLQRFIEALLPWHPAIHWIAGQLDFEREVACDDWVVQATGQSKAYAMCLTRVAEYGGATDAVLTTPTVIGIRSDLSRRVDSLLARRSESRPNLSKMRFAGLAMLLVGVTLASGKPRETIAFQEPAQSKNELIQEIIDAAPGAPPELAADGLLKLVERGEITDSKQKRVIVEEAWYLAPKARYPFEIVSAVASATSIDSDPGSLRAALDPGMSIAGLQSRAIAQMGLLDPKVARELFLQMTPPQIESVDCSADRYTSHSSYFKALGTALQTFSPEETDAGERTKFLKNALRTMTSPEDLRLSLEVLQSDTMLTDREFVELIDGWSRTLSEARFSDRAFSALPLANLSNPVIEVAGQVKTKGGPAEVPMRALRTYFVKHAGAIRCADGPSRARPIRPGAPVTTTEDYILLIFNRAIANLALDIPPIRSEEIQQSGIGGSATVENYLPRGENSKVWQIKLAYSELRFGTAEQQAINNKTRIPDGVQRPYLTLEQRSTAAWNEQALRYLTQLETWSRDFGESNREIFFQKSEWYGALLEIAPDGKLRDSLLKSYVNFLATSPIQRESPPEWVIWVNRLIDSKEVRDQKEWLNQIEASGDATLRLYVGLARLAMDKPVPVLR